MGQTLARARGLVGRGRWPGVLGSLVTARDWSVARRFMVIYLALLVVAALAMGLWVGQEVEDGIVSRTAAVTSLYIESFVSPHLQSLQSQRSLSAADVAALHDLMAGTELGQNVVSFKVWSPDGVILYSVNPELIGQRFPLDGDLVRSLHGEIMADVSQLTADENAVERLRWTRLVQTYVPIRADGSGTILASAEFYQLPDALDAEVGAARLRAWEVVLLAAVASYLLVGFIVQRAAVTIGRQRQRLLDQVEELSSLFHQVTNLNERLQVAGAQTIEVATQERRRISADMHDGPIQAMALAMLRLESFEESVAQPGHDDPRVGAAHEAINDALAELRQIAAGLRLPDLVPLTVDEVVRRAIADHERRSGLRVETDMVDLAVEASLAVKIALFRGLEEALSNATRHGQGIGLAVHAARHDGSVTVEIADRGPGFRPDAERSGGLGLAGMEERTTLLGGSFAVDSQPGAGTRVRITLPFEEPRQLDPRAPDPAPTTEAESPA